MAKQAAKRAKVTSDAKASVSAKAATTDSKVAPTRKSGHAVQFNLTKEGWVAARHAMVDLDMTPGEFYRAAVAAYIAKQSGK